MKSMKSRALTQAAMIAALYVVLTLLANSFGLASNAIQLRFSEALTILPFFTPAAIPGLAIGCFISNLLSGCILLDLIFGTFATLLGALGTYALGRWIKTVLPSWLYTIPPIAANTLIVPFVLKYGYGIPALGLSMLTVGLGEIVSCGILGTLFMMVLKRYRNLLFH